MRHGGPSRVTAADTAISVGDRVVSALNGAYAENSAQHISDRPESPTITSGSGFGALLREPDALQISGHR